MTLLIGLLILGTLGLLFTLPGGRANLVAIGWLLLAGAGGVTIALLTRLAVGDQPTAWIIAFGVVALLAGVRVITHPKPVYSALYFVLLIIAVTGMLVQMHAGFLAAALVLVYAGAILVTYIFVIMFAQQARPAPYDVRSRKPVWSILAGFAMLGMLAVRLMPSGDGHTVGTETEGAVGNVLNVGTLLLTEYAVGVELIGLLLLAAMVGAIAIARRRPTTSPGTEGED